MRIRLQMNQIAPEFVERVSYSLQATPPKWSAILTAGCIFDNKKGAEAPFLLLFKSYCSACFSSTL